MSLHEEIVPLEWKKANIIPLFKKGSRNKSVNYRPVSLRSETIIRDHMMDFLIKHKLLNPSQHGFLKARACLTNSLCFFEEITKWVDDGSPVDAIYLDFQKAFDKVPHQRLTDTKLFRKTKEIGDKQKLQYDIDKLVRWSKKWQMLFNFGKCKCLHTGPGNIDMNYEMGGTILSKTMKEKDVGVTMNANIKVSE